MRARAYVCVWECVCVPTGCLLGQALPRKAMFSPGAAVFTGRSARREVGFGGPSGGEGAVCSPDAEAFVEAGVLLSPGCSHGLSPKVQLRAGWPRLNTRSLGPWGLLQELGGGGSPDSSAGFAVPPSS